MKEFTTAAVEAVEDAAAKREERIKAYVAEGMSREDAEKKVNKEDGVIEFILDGRKMRSFKPTPGQLTFMMAAMGRGQAKESKYASIVNLMLETFEEDDQEYLESRLLSRKPSEALDLDQLEEIFEHLTEEWFSTPTDA